MPGIAAQEQTLNAQPAVQEAEETTAVAEHSEPKYVETVTSYDAPEPTAADFDEMSFELAPIVVTASRMEESILKAKADMSVVGREEIEQMHMENVEEVLRTVPGVQFLDYGSNGLNAQRKRYPYQRQQGRNYHGLTAYALMTSRAQATAVICLHRS